VRTCLISALQELHAAKVDLFLHQQALDTTTPAGKAMFGMMGVFAEFERSMGRGQSERWPGTRQGAWDKVMRAGRLKFQQ
jgi:DNA invertase Pin-like site-specific DNA recombinase